MSVHAPASPTEDKQYKLNLKVTYNYVFIKYFGDLHVICDQLYSIMVKTAYLLTIQVSIFNVYTITIFRC